MSVSLTPVPDEGALYIENDRIEGQRWRLWIPEVFIAERDTDRFLKVARPDAQEYPITVQWERGDNRVSYVWTNEGAGPVPLEYSVCASAGNNLVDLQFTVKNIGRTDWPKLFSAAVCLSNAQAPAFIDLDGKRSTLFPEIGPRTAWDLVEEVQSMPTPEWFNISFYVGKPEHPSLAHWKEVKHGLVSRQSEDGEWHVALGWDTVARVEIVLGTDSMSCIHSHPQFAKLAPGETLTRYGRIWFSKRRPDQMLQRYLVFVAQEKRTGFTM